MLWGYLVIGVGGAVGYLVVVVGGATVQLLLDSVQSLQEGRLRSCEEVMRSAGGGLHLIPQVS